MTRAFLLTVSFAWVVACEVPTGPVVPADLLGTWSLSISYRDGLDSCVFRNASIDFVDVSPDTTQVQLFTHWQGIQGRCIRGGIGRAAALPEMVFFPDLTGNRLLLTAALTELTGTVNGRTIYGSGRTVLLEPNPSPIWVAVRWSARKQ